jgi:hypothetical protein
VGSFGSLGLLQPTRAAVEQGVLATLLAALSSAVVMALLVRSQVGACHRLGASIYSSEFRARPVMVLAVAVSTLFQIIVLGLQVNILVLALKTIALYFTPRPVLTAALMAPAVYASTLNTHSLFKFAEVVVVVRIIDDWFRLVAALPLWRTAALHEYIRAPGLGTIGLLPAFLSTLVNANSLLLIDRPKDARLVSRTAWIPLAYAGFFSVTSVVLLFNVLPPHLALDQPFPTIGHLGLFMIGPIGRLDILFLFLFVARSLTTLSFTTKAAMLGLQKIGLSSGVSLVGVAATAFLIGNLSLLPQRLQGYSEMAGVAQVLSVLLLALAVRASRAIA